MFFQTPNFEFFWSIFFAGGLATKPIGQPQWPDQESLRQWSMALAGEGPPMPKMMVVLWAVMAWTPKMEPACDLRLIVWRDNRDNSDGMNSVCEIFFHRCGIRLFFVAVVEFKCGFWRFWGSCTIVLVSKLIQMLEKYPLLRDYYCTLICFKFKNRRCKLITLVKLMTLLLKNNECQFNWLVQKY